MNYREVMSREINALRPLCDFLVVSMHWGEEYEHHYNTSQKNLAAFLAEHSVDLVIGHHPHVIQPVEYMLRPDGRFMLCFYSLGNLISAQDRPQTMLGALAYVKIEKKYSIAAEDDSESINANILFTDAGAIPVVTHVERGWTNFEVVPLHEYAETFIGKHRMNDHEKRLGMNYLTGLASDIFKHREIKRNPFDTSEN